MRNTKVTYVIAGLDSLHSNLDIYDPWASAAEVKHEYGLELTETLKENHYDAIIITVGHNEIKNMGISAIRKLCKTNSVIFEVKYLFDKDDVDDRL